jgi:site-specific recombinase XerD
MCLPEPTLNFPHLAPLRESIVELNRFYQILSISLAHFPLSSKEKRKVFFMQDYLQLMTTSMELKGFAKSTQKTYLAHLRRFAEFSGKLPAPAGYDDVRAFLYHAISVRKLSSAYVNSAYGAIKFFFQTALCREWNMLHVPRVKKKYSLPVILSPQEVFQTINATNNLKHKAMLSTIYSAGLRVSEVAHLKVADIDSSRMRIFVRQAKGNKDRYSILSEKNLFLLREYWKLYRPKDWLFPGVPATKPISSRTIQTVFHHCLIAAGIAKDATVHTLRHCFATHLLNSGADILQIKDLLGHSDIRTTSMYLHLSHAQVLGLKSPLDCAPEGDFHA